MKKPVLIALSDSMSSKAVLDYLSDLPLCTEEFRIVLLHVFRKPSGGEELMGKKYMMERPAKYEAILEAAKETFIEKGVHPDDIEIRLVLEPYPTIADGIIDQVRKINPAMVVIGRKRMSKAEEFVLGDISIKLVRAVDRTAVLIVKLS